MQEGRREQQKGKASRRKKEKGKRGMRASRDWSRGEQMIHAKNGVWDSSSIRQPRIHKIKTHAATFAVVEIITSIQHTRQPANHVPDLHDTSGRFGMSRGGAKCQVTVAKLQDPPFRSRMSRWYPQGVWYLTGLDRGGWRRQGGTGSSF